MMASNSCTIMLLAWRRTGSGPMEHHCDITEPGHFVNKFVCQQMASLMMMKSPLERGLRDGEVLAWLCHRRWSG